MTGITDKEVEQEIELLRLNPDVQLARLELRLKYKRRQHLYALRNLAKRGKELREQGYTYENLSSQLAEKEPNEEDEESETR